MNNNNYSRRQFIRSASASTALGLAGISLPAMARPQGPLPATAPQQDALREPVKIGIIGLDTSHSAVFTRFFNAEKPDPGLEGFRVVAAVADGSHDIASALKERPAVTEAVRKQGVEVVPTIEELLDKVDVVLLETNDGRLHLEQALPVFRAGKRVFIDKPVAGSLAQAIAIYKAAAHYNTPVFSSSSLRYMDSVKAIVHDRIIGEVLGAETYSPAVIEKTHPDLFWYGVHGVETLFSVMGTGCTHVSRIYTEGADVVTGIWNNERLGTFRGIRKGHHDFGGRAFGEKGIAPIGPFEGYKNLLIEIAGFFRTGKVPLAAEETLEIFAFMEAADASKQKKGAPIALEKIMRKADRKSESLLNDL